MIVEIHQLDDGRWPRFLGTDGGAVAASQAALAALSSTFWNKQIDPRARPQDGCLLTGCLLLPKPSVFLCVFLCGGGNDLLLTHTISLLKISLLMSFHWQSLIRNITLGVHSFRKTSCLLAFKYSLFQLAMRAYFFLNPTWAQQVLRIYSDGWREEKMRSVAVKERDKMRPVGNQAQEMYRGEKEIPSSFSVLSSMLWFVDSLSPG